MEQIKIPLANRNPMVFRGEQIAFVTSCRPGAYRWTEMTIYRTEDGTYVFRRTGRSAVYHRPTCRRIFGRMDLRTVAEPPEEGVPCDTCLPETDDAAVMLESDKEFARMTGDLRQLVWAAHQEDRKSHAMTLTTMGREVLEEAAKTDPEIMDVVLEMMAEAASRK